jgi:hypothetical protein
MKSYTQFVRSHLDPNFGESYDLKAYVTEKRKLTLKLKPTSWTSQSWELCLQKYFKRAECIKEKLEKYFSCLEKIQTEFDSFKSKNY